MKKQELQEYRKKKINTLESELDTLQKKLAETKLKLQRGELKNTREPKNIRLSITQLKTIINEKRIAKESK